MILMREVTFWFKITRSTNGYYIQYVYDMMLNDNKSFPEKKILAPSRLKVILKLKFLILYG